MTAQEFIEKLQRETVMTGFLNPYAYWYWLKYSGMEDSFEAYKAYHLALLHSDHDYLPEWALKEFYKMELERFERKVTP